MKLTSSSKKKNGCGDQNRDLLGSRIETRIQGFFMGEPHNVVVGIKLWDFEIIHGCGRKIKMKW